MDNNCKSFLKTLLNLQDIPNYAILLISQLSLSTSDGGILCPQLHAGPDFVMTIASIRCQAILGFKLHKNFLPFVLHPSLSNLFTIESNPHSLILLCFHCLIRAHNNNNNIHDSLLSILTLALSSAGYLLPASKFNTEPMHKLPLDPTAFNITHSCPYTFIGAKITISCYLPQPSFDVKSSDILQILLVNVTLQLQVYECWKLSQVTLTQAPSYMATLLLVISYTIT